ncbi:hypothetical protein GCM10007852_32700 [Agaribacter marinus]|uniref:Uncharacterized protein n=1 Tax=Agaribacter marinus TaxID=1431249 RepID=A0AA37WJP1_9ALTE|nr:hypothetical protein GCM10007852_32700 [Agaribacter marinus]
MYSSPSFSIYDDKFANASNPIDLLLSDGICLSPNQIRDIVYISGLTKIDWRCVSSISIK